MSKRSMYWLALPALLAICAPTASLAQPGPDLTASKSCTVGANQSVTCTITIHNIGNVPSVAPMTVVDTVNAPPPGTQLTGAGGTLPVSCPGAGPYAGPIPCQANTSLAPGQFGTVIIAFRLPSGGTFNNCATVSQARNAGTPGDPDPSNNTGCTTISVTGSTSAADLSAVKACTPTQGDPQSVDCNITVLNHGNGPSASPFTLVDTVPNPPPGLLYAGTVMGGTTVSCSPNPGPYSPVTCTGNYALGVGQSASPILRFTAPSGGSFRNCVHVTQAGSPTEANMADNTYCIAVTIPSARRPDLSAVKACTPDSQRPHTVNCNITVLNHGNAISISPFTLIDTPAGQPPGLMYGGTAMGGTTVSCNRGPGPMPSGSSVTCTGNYALAPTQSGSPILIFSARTGMRFRNCVRVSQGSGSPAETNLSDNTYCTLVTIP